MNIVNTFLVNKLESIEGLPIKFERVIHEEILLNPETRPSGELLMVRFPKLSQRCFVDDVINEMKKNGVRCTSSNLFLSFVAAQEQSILLEQHVMNSLIVFNEDGEPDLCRYLEVVPANGVLHAHFELETPDCVYDSESLFIVERIVEKDS